jgi:hypothetical protein
VSGRPASPQSTGARDATIPVILYVGLALGLDALAFLGVRSPVDWTLLRWTLGDFDLYKFIVWLLLPLAFAWRRLDRGWYGIARWKRRDAFILAALLLAGFAALLLIPRLPGVAELYPGTRLLPAHERWVLFGAQLLWSLSWVPGYEFLMRYLLLRAASARWPRHGWWLVPLAEGLYHLQKPWIECAAMVLFSILLTRWALVRRNGLLPLLAHLLVELELGLVLLLV